MSVANFPMRPTETSKKIVSMVAALRKIPPEKILGRRSFKEEVKARILVAYILRKHFNYSLGKTGGCIGREHSTISHLMNKVSQRDIDDAKIIMDQIASNKVAAE